MNDDPIPTPSVGVIGLGAMGAGIARTLLQGGYRVSVWNRSRPKVDALAAEGAIPSDEPGALLDAHTHVVVCLSDYAAWHHIIESHALAGRFDDTCIIQLTTGTIDDVQKHASFMAANGARLADGAVMCFPSNLGTDAAALLLSGAPDVLASCDGILSVLDANWTNLGEDINGPATLSRALMAGMTAALMGVVNGAAMCRAGGVPLDVFMKFYDRNGGLIQSEQRRIVEAIAQGRTEENEASIKAWREGNQALISVAAALGTDLTLQNALQAMFQKGRQQGLDGHDLSALVDVFDPGSDS